MTSGSHVDVSVVLPVFNEVGHLATEIHGIQEALQSSPLSFEIVVVDDGSTDGSTEALRRIDGIRLIEFDHTEAVARLEESAPKPPSVPRSLGQM